MRTSDASIEKSESSKISPPLKTGSLLQLLCKFNGGCRPESLHIAMRNKYNENLQFLQKLTSTTNEDIAAAGIGQREFSDV
ncbi:unnamed protein product [Meloidogyne enterolobii]|uniref:Uncharacterized protein n=1 Tax=Meloidogyne enterolobii TaxID=390850 RepID=A0ACB1AM11_MELEN